MTKPTTFRTTPKTLKEYWFGILTETLFVSIFGFGGLTLAAFCFTKGALEPTLSLVFLGIFISTSIGLLVAIRHHSGFVLEGDLLEGRLEKAYAKWEALAPANACTVDDGNEICFFEIKSGDDGVEARTLVLSLPGWMCERI